MTNIVMLPQQESIEVVASEWVARIDRGLSQGEEKQFIRWLSGSEAHSQLFLEMAEMWDDLDAMSYLKTLRAANEPDIEQQSQHQSGWGQRLWKAPMYGAVAASLAICAIALHFLIQSSPGNLTVHYYHTQVGEVLTVRLPDQSLMYLDTASDVRLEFSDDERRIYLSNGQMHIEVAHDKNRPLVVEASGRTFQAIGTAFTVRNENTTPLTLTVTEGTVGVSSLPQEVEAAPNVHPLPKNHAKVIRVEKGQRATIDRSQVSVEKIDSNTLEKSMAWTQKTLVFEEDPLVDVLREVSRYTDVRIVIKDKSLENIAVFGVFDAKRPEAIVKLLEENFDVRADWVTAKLVELHSERGSDK